MRTVFCWGTAARAGTFGLANDVVGVVVTRTGSLGRSTKKRIDDAEVGERRKQMDVLRGKD
jgi:hypothetical protein